MGVKPLESRDWKTSYRGPLLIHAGKRDEGIESLPESVRLSSPLVVNFLTKPPGGLLKAVVNLDGCYDLDDQISVDALRDKVGEEVIDEWAGSGQYLWLFTGARLLRRPVPYKGQLGLFNVPDELIKDLL